MGYTLRTRDTQKEQYLGSVTMLSLADNGAFDTEVGKESEDLCNGDESMMAIVDANGVDLFLAVAQSGRCRGKWLDKVIEFVKQNCADGFIVTY